MEFRMFGRGGYPSDGFEKGLRILLSLDEVAWEEIAKWFLSTENFDAQGVASSSAIAASSLMPEQFMESVEALRYILESWHDRGLQLPEIQRDFMLLGCSKDEIERLARMLERLSVVKERVYTQYIRSVHENAVLPTLQDINVACDVRPIFEDFVYPAPEAKSKRHTNLLGLSYMVLMELTTEDSNGNSCNLSFQMTEDQLADFQAALERAGEQLDILKVKTRGLSSEHH